VARIDDAAGSIRKTLAETGLDRNTILVFMSDHGCHFKTRNTEYKRSPHESSIHIPLIIEGPGFNRSLEISELVSHVDLAPALLDAAGVAVPASMQGHSFLGLLDRRTQGWRNEVYFEMSEFVTGRGLRTAAVTHTPPPRPRDPAGGPFPRPTGYVEYALYDHRADPLPAGQPAGRAPYAKIAEALRQRLIARIQEASGASAAVEPCWFPYP